MAYRSLLLLVFLFLMAACQEEKKPLPIPEDKMIDVLVDIHIAEAAGQQMRGRLKDSMMNEYYEQIGRMHEVDANTVKKTMEQLRQEPERLQQLYEKALERMGKLDAHTQ